MNNREEQNTNPSRFGYNLGLQYSKEIENLSSEYILSKEGDTLKRDNETTTPQKWANEIQHFLINNGSLTLSDDHHNIFKILTNNDDQSDNDEEEEDFDNTLKYKKLQTLMFSNRSKKFRKPAEELKAAKKLDEFLTGWFIRYYKVRYLDLEEELKNCRNLESIFEELNKLDYEINYTSIRGKIMSLFEKRFLFQDDENIKEPISIWSQNSTDEILDIGKQLGFEKTESDLFIMNLYSLFHHFYRLLSTENYSMSDLKTILKNIFNSNFNKKDMLNNKALRKIILNNIDDADNFEKFKIVHVPTENTNKFTLKCFYKSTNKFDQDYNNIWSESKGMEINEVEDNGDYSLLNEDEVENLQK
ncbi:hypothetical protein ACO0SA_002548 [Hanseniaspora valbyensis]